MFNDYSILGIVLEGFAGDGYIYIEYSAEADNDFSLDREVTNSKRCLIEREVVARFCAVLDS